MSNDEPIRILLVDDDAHVRLMLRSVLDIQKWDIVAEADNGADGVALHREHRPTMTLMDINMRGMDGIAALKAIREHDATACVVMLTSNFNAANVDQCFTAGATHFIRKDVTIDKLTASLEEAIKVCRKKNA